MSDIVEAAINSGWFNALVKAIRAAGLFDNIEAPCPFAVFSPTDKAFAEIPKQILISS